VRAAAWVAEAGIDPIWFLNTANDLEQLIAQSIAKVAEENRQRRDRNLAIQIANAVGRMLSGKKSG